MLKKIEITSTVITGIGVLNTIIFMVIANLAGNNLSWFLESGIDYNLVEFLEGITMHQKLVYTLDEVVYISIIVSGIALAVSVIVGSCIESREAEA